jgi:hypothetical protein
MKTVYGQNKGEVENRNENEETHPLIYSGFT